MGDPDPPSNTWFLGPTQILNSNGISIGSVIFAQLMAEHPYTLQWDALFPSKLPLPMGASGSHLILIHDSLGLPEPITETTCRLVQPFFAQVTEECPYTSQWAAPSPLKIAPSYGGKQ